MLEVAGGGPIHQAFTDRGRWPQVGTYPDGTRWLEDAALDQTWLECVQWSKGVGFCTLTASINRTWSVVVFELIKNEGNPDN